MLEDVSIAVIVIHNEYKLLIRVKQIEIHSTHSFMKFIQCIQLPWPPNANGKGAYSLLLLTLTFVF